MSNSERYLDLIKELATSTDEELKSLRLSSSNAVVIDLVLEYKRANGIVDDPNESSLDRLAKLPEWEIRSLGLNQGNFEIVNMILRHKAEKGL